MIGDICFFFMLVQVDGGYIVIFELDKEIMCQLQDDSVMCFIVMVKIIKINEYQKLVLVGGIIVKCGIEGEVCIEISIFKMECVDIKFNLIYVYLKIIQEIFDFFEVDILGWLFFEIIDIFIVIEEIDFVNGDGDKKFKGFLFYLCVVISDKICLFGMLEKMEVVVVFFDGLIDLLYKLKVKYCKNVVWVMNFNIVVML